MTNSSSPLCYRRSLSADVSKLTNREKFENGSERFLLGSANEAERNCSPFGRAFEPGIEEAKVVGWGVANEGRVGGRPLRGSAGRSHPAAPRQQTIRQRERGLTVFQAGQAAACEL